MGNISKLGPKLTYGFILICFGKQGGAVVVTFQALESYAEGHHITLRSPCLFLIILSAQSSWTLDQ